MTDFTEQDLSDSRFEKVHLQRATFRDVSLVEASFTDVDLSGVRIHAAWLDKVRMTGVEVPDLEINGEIGRLVVNGVEVGPLVEAELDRRHPERAAMRPTTADGFREAFAILDRLWGETLDRARVLPKEQLHEEVDGEWSFIQTLRHLNFASAAWVGRMVLGNPSPWHPLDLPWDEAPGWDGIPWDREAQPSLDEVLTIRHERQAMVGEVMASLTGEQLASSVTRTEPGWPQAEEFPLQECLHIVLIEEWEHRLYAERDLTVLETT
jgi:hypothetical protein